MPAPAYSITSVVAHGATIRVGRGDTPTWTAITGLQNVEWPDQMPADDDITNMASPGYAEENMPGILPAVDFAADMLLDDGSAGDTALVALNARDAATGEKELHLLEITAGDKTITHVAYVKQYKPIAPIKGRVAMRCTWRVMQVVANAA
jgi:hypothetical protein